MYQNCKSAGQSNAARTISRNRSIMFAKKYAK